MKSIEIFPPKKRLLAQRNAGATGLFIFIFVELEVKIALEIIRATIENEIQ